MTVAIRGVLCEHPWLAEVVAERDLDEDLFSLVVKRAAAYGFSSTRFTAGAELGGQRWGHADAGGDWTRDGQVRQLAWLTVYPATGLREQHLPVLPMTRVLTDALHRVGVVRFAGLRVTVPVQLAPDAGFDLVGDADWYALAAPQARTRVLVTVTVAVAVSAADEVAQHVRELVNRRGHGVLRVESASHSDQGLSVPPGGDGDCAGRDGGTVGRSVFVCDVPEWAPDAAAWLTDVFIDSLRAAGVREEVEITVDRTPAIT